MNKKWLQQTPFLLSLLVFTYVLLRAVILDITYDEAWSIGTYVTGTYKNIMTYVPCDSNNHLINSLLIKTLYLILPETTFVARLPSLLAFFLYLRFAQLLTKSENHPAGPFVFILLIGNPFLLEFFSLARGYSLSMAAVLGSLYYFTRYDRSLKLSNLAASLGLAAFSGLSVFSFLNFFAGLLLISFLHLLFKKKSNYAKVLGLLVLVAGSVAGLLWIPFQRLTQFGNLYYGGGTGIWQDTLLSLTRYSQYSMFPLASTALVLSLVLLCLATLIVISLRGNARPDFSRSWVLLLLLSCLLINSLQVKLINGFYLIDRTALFLYPLFMLAPWYFLKPLPVQKLSYFIFALLAVFFFGNTLVHANGQKTLTWFFDSRTREILSTFEERGKKENRKIPVGCSWPFEKTLTWYLSQEQYPHVEFRWDPEYYLYLDSGLDQIDYYPQQEKLEQYRHGIVSQYPKEHIFVFKR